MVGTMVDVGLGRRDVGEIQRLLEGAGDGETSPPAPPEGLYLTRVYYDDDNWSGEDAVHEILS
jgi:tRNA pseudouridine38-40 synthase